MLSQCCGAVTERLFTISTKIERFLYFFVIGIKQELRECYWCPDCKKECQVREAWDAS
jgi:hypothetical protein